MSAPRQARRIGTYRGKPLYRIPVEVHLNNSRELRTIGIAHYEVIAHTAVAAANLLRDEWAQRAETEIFAYGPSGGRAHRYIGWETAIMAQMAANRTGQGSLDLEWTE